MIDAHCHLTDPAFEKEIGIVIEKAKIAGVKAMINNAGNLEESKRGVELAEKYPEVWTTVGINPTESTKSKILSSKEYLKLTNHKKVIANGETGLDYREGITDEEKNLQTDLFKWNLELAKEAELPVVVHCRNAWEEIYQVLRVQCSFLKGIQMHCWTGSREWAEKFLDLGCYLSFGGIITFKKSQELREVVRLTPEEKLLLETDAPYIAPEPVRGSRNESGNVKIIAEAVAQARNISREEVDRLTTLNTRRLFEKLKL